MSIDKSGNIKRYVDAEFVVNKDVRIHNGDFTTIGTVGTYVQSRKHNMNTKISNEVNIVRVDDVLAQVLWNRYFLKEKGYKIHDYIICQNNHISIKLEKNGRQ